MNTKFMSFSFLFSPFRKEPNRRKRARGRKMTMAVKMKMRRKKQQQRKMKATERQMMWKT